MGRLRLSLVAVTVDSFFIVHAQVEDLSILFFKEVFLLRQVLLQPLESLMRRVKHFLSTRVFVGTLLSVSPGKLSMVLASLIVGSLTHVVILELLCVLVSGLRLVWLIITQVR